jgi:hypothetical protein
VHEISAAGLDKIKAVFQEELAKLRDVGQDLDGGYEVNRERLINYTL